MASSRGQSSSKPNWPTRPSSQSQFSPTVGLGS
jgi:hypothetical protein